MNNMKTGSLEFGDVVEHRLFGVGKIIDIVGDKVTVQFEDGSEKRILNSFVQKISDGHDKGIKYWKIQWDELVNDWRSSRKEVDAIIPKLFRPTLDEKSLNELLLKLEEHERSELISRGKIELFIEEDAYGNHM